MKTVIEGRIDVFPYRATLRSASFIASNRATLTIETPRTWYGRFVGPVLPVPGGKVERQVELSEIAHAGKLETFAKNILRESCGFPQAVKTT